MLDEDRYVSLFKQLSARGWRREQPVQVAVERPRAYRKMAELLFGSPVDVLAQHADVSQVPRAPVRPPNVVELAARRQRGGAR